MQDSTSLSIRMARQSDRRQIDNLVKFGTYVHRHFDWYEPHEFIDHQPFYVAEWKFKIMAVLACPPDLEGVVWIRLFAAVPELQLNDAWRILWANAHESLKPKDLIVAAIPVHTWFQEILSTDNFDHIVDVISLEWRNKALQPYLKNPAFRIRKLLSNDIPAVHKVDEAAFDLIWRSSENLLETALLKSTIATVAESSEGIIGYQISTASSSGGHLARLAVLPKWQGCGVGYALVWKLLEQFQLWGTLRVTVNTQTDNIPSLALYKKVGFRSTEEIYPVYRKQY